MVILNGACNSEYNDNFMDKKTNKKKTWWSKSHAFCNIHRDIELVLEFQAMSDWIGQ